MSRVVPAAVARPDVMVVVIVGACGTPVVRRVAGRWCIDDTPGHRCLRARRRRRRRCGRGAGATKGWLWFQSHVHVTARDPWHRAVTLAVLPYDQVSWLEVAESKVEGLEVGPRVAQELLPPDVVGPPEH